MRRAVALLAVLSLIASPHAYAAGTVTTTEVTHTSVKKITFSWTSAASGAADATTTAAFDGKLLGCFTDPGATAPTDNYDIVLNDADGHDVLNGAGANRDTATTEYILDSALGAVSGSRLTLAVTNAGDAKVGVLVCWIR